MRAKAAIGMAATGMMLIVGQVEAAQFTDTFSTSPGAMDRSPFVWDQFNAYHGAGSAWRAAEGAIEYRAEDQTGTYTGLGFASAGIDLSDETAWSLEVGFRHVSGVVPKDYLAFTDEGPLAPGEGNWVPAADREPVAKGLNIVATPDVFNQTPHPGIEVTSKEKGTARWEQAIPQVMRRYRPVMKATPSPMEVDFYRYPDDGPSRQNVYQNAYLLKYDENRRVANAMLTRGVGDTATGFMDYKMWYRVSTDGGHTYGELRPIVQQGEPYSPMHPIEYVHVGKNSFCYATIPGIMLKLTNGQIFFPCYYAPLDAEGNYYNPLNAYTFSWVCGIIGTWNETGDDLTWDVSKPVVIQADQSSRGADECAVVELAGIPGHLLMVIRGSNEPNPTGKIPAGKWKTLSTDYGKTWSKCESFTFDDGKPFLSPSSCCSFIRSSRTGKCYWVGNISRTLPRGNWPRYPLVIGELDEEKLALRRNTVTIIDDRTPDDPADLQLSNYGLLEDEKTGEIILHVNRWVPGGEAPGAGPHTYVIRVE